MSLAAAGPARRGQESPLYDIATRCGIVSTSDAAGGALLRTLLRETRIAA
jgi:hypothetical protein